MCKFTDAVTGKFIYVNPQHIEAIKPDINLVHLFLVSGQEVGVTDSLVIVGKRLGFDVSDYVH